MDSNGRKWLILVIVIVVAAGSIGYLVFSPYLPPRGGLTNPSSAAWTGRQAPSFTLPTVNGTTFDLNNEIGKSYILLYFHEGLDCAPCLNQLKALNTDYKNFTSINVSLVAISTDSVSGLASWAKLNGISHVTVLSDPSLKVDTTYQTLGSNVSMMPGGMAGHTFILTNKSGTIIWRDDYGPGTMYVDDATILQKVQTAISSSG